MFENRKRRTMHSNQSGVGSDSFVQVKRQCSDEDNLSVASASSHCKAMNSSFTIQSPFKERIFGDEIQDNYIIDTSLLKRMEEHDLARRRAREEEEGSIDSASDCGTETSSVAQLRDWLDGFGKQQKDHYLKNKEVGKAPADLNVEKPTRPKVRRSTTRTGPTPLPPVAAKKISKRIEPKVDPAYKARVNPLRYKAKVPKEDVQATDEGYASVAKLSKWLADDPTRTRKPKSIRRGANIIAKSRVFDKELENVVVEEKIATANVKNRKVWLESGTSESAEERDDVSAVSSSQGGDFRTMSWSGSYGSGRPSLDSSTVSVSDKKKWLTNAFDKRECIDPSKGGSDVSTGQDERDAASDRAKQMWRSKRPPPSQTHQSTAALKAESTQRVENANSIFRDQTPERREPEPQKVARQVVVSPPPVDFRAARQRLVDRSRANGVEVDSQVQRRKFAFERKERRAPSGPECLTKTSWESTEDTNSAGGGFTKKLVPHISQRKSLQELP